jgi:hypothetical protein
MAKLYRIESRADIMKSRELNIGTAGEHLVVADLLLKNVDAFITGQGMNYDVVADMEGRLIRIQVKTTMQKRLMSQRANPIYFFHIKRTGKGGTRFYTHKDFDVYALVALDIRQVFYLLNNDSVKSSSICVRDRNVNYSGHNGGGRPSGFYFQDMTWEKCANQVCTGKTAEKIN